MRAGREGEAEKLMEVVGGRERERERGRGTCSGALPKSPIITSKLDLAREGLSDTGALYEDETLHRYTSKKPISLSLSLPPSLPHFLLPSFTLLHPGPSYFTSVLLSSTLCYLFLITRNSFPTILLPPSILSVSLTAGCLDSELYMRAPSIDLSQAAAEFLHPLWL